MPTDFSQWRFWIDVGGTFTDCIARTPSGELTTHKLLSTGCYLTTSAGASTAVRWQDQALRAVPPDYFAGYRFTCHPLGGEAISRTVAAFEPATGTLTLDSPLPFAPTRNFRAELSSDEEAPVAGIRWLLGLPLSTRVGPVQVRLGTTRATNALLERRGARTALVTTAGFTDGLRIGSQDRPHLFDLHISQPPELYETVAEISARLAADGSILQPLDEAAARAALSALRSQGIESLAVCLLHAYRNPVHELRLGHIAAELGFAHVSLSHRVSPLPKFIYRGDTTVLDAYLTPVLRDYSRQLAAQLPDADLRFMTSAGSLVTLENFSGKDAILSGPAGGVVGTARLTDRAGLSPAFAFDMGGTSTDVSRWNGEAFTRRYETEAAGSQIRRHRLQTSMLEIETVAAGGGSVCWFDGEKLAVGPRSAGADPGPACYGRGGPLTVTDLNFYLGRVPRFPFALDLAAVETRLDDLLTQISASAPSSFILHPSSFSPSALADGFLRIANAAMVAPIKKLAASRGDDVRTHTLVAFGGAGGQHACAVARELGMTRILCTPHAGVLSALGIGLAGITKFAERSLTPTDDPAAVLASLETDLRAQLAAEGFPAERLAPPRRTLEMRYNGQETRLPIPEPAGGDFPAAFTREHQRLFNFIFPGRPVENYAARVELTSLADTLPAASPTPATIHPVPAFRTKVWFDSGDQQDTPVFERSSLHPGHRLEGPAVILEAVATVVIEPGWTAELTIHDDILLDGRATTSVSKENALSRRPDALEQDTIKAVLAPITATRQAERPSDHPTIPVPADIVELELYHGRFASVAEQMGAALQRTALSTNVKERLDFSCALFDHTGALVANAAHIPVHLGAMQACVRCLRADVPDLRPGEVYVTNDPFRGGSHLPDVTVVTPVFTADSPLPAFFTASRAHHAEIGGITPGSLPPGAKTLAEEGVLLRAFRYDTARASESDTALRALLLSGPYPSRSPDENLADLHAQIAANQTGVLLLQGLIAQQGLSAVTAYTIHLQRTAENRMRAALQRLVAEPSTRDADTNSGPRLHASFSGERTRPRMPWSAPPTTSGTAPEATLPESSTVASKTARGARAFPEPFAPPTTSPVSSTTRNPQRATRNFTSSFRDTLDDGSPIALSLTVRADGSATFDFTGSGPVHPGNLNANPAIVASAVIYCLRCLLGEPVPLNAGLLAPVEIIVPPNTLLNPTGDPDPRRCPAVGGGNVETSQRLVDVILGALGLAAASQGTMNNLLFGRGGDDAFGYYETIGGGSGATSAGPGASAVHVHMTNTRLTDPEVLETRYPVRLREWSIRRGSGGAGAHCGGDGMVRELEFLAPLSVSLLTNRRLTAPYGAAGGKPGQPGRNLLRRSGETVFTDLPPAGTIEVHPGDILRLETPGGGGWGPDVVIANSPTTGFNTAS